MANGAVSEGNTAPWSTLLIKVDGFGPEERGQLDADLRRFGGELLYPLPREERKTRVQAVVNEYANARPGDEQASLAAVPYDVSPVYDDSPFFFHYDRLRDLWNVENDRNPGELIRGHWVSFTLVWLLVFVAFAVALFIMLPLWRMGGDPTFAWAPWATYFACIGVSFMFVEISLMQRFALLLGHPSRALALVLGSLLFFAGVGSYTAGYVRPAPQRVLAVLAVGILCAALAYPAVIRAALSWPLWGRAAVTVALVAPLGVLMGMPFPLAIRQLGERTHGGVAWMWGVNGGATVLGSVLAIAIAIGTGFTAVLTLAAAGYLLAALVYPES
jgi:hypothetical protein